MSNAPGPDSQLICVVSEGKTYVPMAEHGVVLRENERLLTALNDIIRIVNRLVTEQQRAVDALAAEAAEAAANEPPNDLG